MIVLENRYGKPYYKAYHDATNNWITTKWIGFVPTNEAVKGVEATLKLIEETGCQNLLSDNSQIKGAWSELNEWMESNWYEPAKKFGLKKHATVLSSDIFSKISHENFEKGQKGEQITMQSFDKISTAEQWLRNS